MLNSILRTLLRAFIFAATSKKARAAITGKIKEMEEAANKDKPGGSKFATVRAEALKWLGANSNRFIDTVVNGLVLLTKG